MKNLKHLNKYFIKYKWHLLLGTIFVGISNFFMVLVPREIRKSLDYIIDKTQSVDSGDTSASFMETFGGDMMKFSALVLGLTVVMGFFLYLTRKTIIVMSRLMEYDMRKEIYEKYQTLDLAFYKINKTGDLMSRVSEDVSKVRMYLGPGVMYSIRVALLFAFVIYSMFQVNVKLSYYTLLPLPFLSISIYYVSRIIHRRSDLIQRQISKLNSIAQEVYSGIRVVKSYAKEDQFYDHFDEQSEDYKVKALKLARVNAMFFPLMILLVSASNLLTVYIGGLLVSKGEITAGNIAEFVIYVNYLTWPITSIGWIASIVQQADASQKRINDMLQVDPQIKNETIDEKTFQGDIEFDNVTFTYPDTGITAVKNVSFKINKGEKLAIVGRTASGKSTFADLLLRFYNVSEGRILIDGKDINSLDLYNLRSKIGYVPQNVFLFSDTIENNIKFGDQNSSEGDIYLAAENAAIKDDIDELQDGFETVIGERGVTLSGGQKQRLSIARALIKNPNIVILDDCLSALDANTEHKILNYLDEELADKTSIIITHRISNLMKFDKIIVLENGSIVEEGTHEELMKNEGYYTQIIKNEFDSTEE
ncbi:MAG: ABC transporter ATP-binding protein [Saprospiraceae bacterium]|nr:ABC transporter ATP-binding protein [Saprospiraceae bacterium]